MQRIALGAFVFGSLLAACGGDSNHNVPPQVDAPMGNHGVCGDGIVDVSSETCDDGNTTSGDGCSATCQTETVNKCGNGVIDSGEICDDGNTAAGDGCNASCIVELGYMCTGTPSVCTMMTAGMGTCASPMTVTLTHTGNYYTGTGMADSTNSTDQVVTTACDMETSSGGGNDQIWTIVNPVAQPVLITLDSSVTDFDAVLRLTTTACDVATEVPDDLLPDDQVSGTSDGCADLHTASADERLNYNNLPAGTYYLVVDGYQAGDDGPYSFTIKAGHGTCGDGIIDADETCDDGNTANADGCDSTCHTEADYTCTGMPSVCLFGGTCTAPFPLTLTHTGNLYTATGMGDTTNATDEFHGASCDSISSSGNGPDQIWTFTNPVAQPVLITVDGTATMFDVTLRLTTTACDLASEVPDDLLPADATSGKSDGCADLHGSGTDERLSYNMLPAGTYFITIDGYSTGSSGAYTFTVKAGAVATCGNGMIETGEACDDGNTAAGDGCNTTCHIENGYTCTDEPSSCHRIVCGDGIIDVGETCDDGNTTAGDGCNATCTIETGYVCTGEPSSCHLTVCGDGVVEGTEECDSTGAHDRCSAACKLVFDVTDTENNSDGTHAQVITPAHHIIKGSLPVGDLDVYKFTLTTPSVVNLESYTTFESTYTSTSNSTIANLECKAADTQIRIFASTADPTVDANDLYSDDDGGDSLCSFLDPGATLPAGTYYFTIHEYQSNDLISRYLVDFKVTPM